ncbi:MAG: TIGR03088 family PEP-CTERM/XrtA system glycosyltransferase [Gammaproteobacteria bacterium]
MSLAEMPLVAHLIYRLDIGGLETLLVDCINRMPGYRHAVICITDYTDFAQRIERQDVSLHALHKPPGLGLGTHADLFKLLRRLKPAVLHTYNLSALEYNFTAALARVPVRVHAEHGRDARDPQGLNARHNQLRRLMAPFVDRFIPVSRDLRDWLTGVVGIAPHKTLLINNGVDTERYQAGAPAALPWNAEPGFVIGTVGRLQDVKDQATLVEAFVRLRALLPEHAARLRLVLVGDGPLRGELAALIERHGIGAVAFLAGARSDIALVMGSFDVFCLSSIAEGTPVTLLEAMASSLPVVSTQVGGIPDLVADGVTGALVPPSDPQALAQALARYVVDAQLARRHGQAGRERIEAGYSISAMVQAYGALYDGLRKTKMKLKELNTPCAE